VDLLLVDKRLKKKKRNTHRQQAELVAFGAFYLVRVKFIDLTTHAGLTAGLINSQRL